MPQQNDALKWLKKATVLIQQDSRSWALISFGYFIFIWTQDVIPLIGYVISSCFVSFLIFRVFTQNWQSKQSILLGILNFPSHVLLAQGASYLNAGQWPEINNFTISFILLFSMILWLFIFYWAIGFIATLQISINAALIAAWKHFRKRYKMAIIHSVLLAALSMASILGWGIGFFITIPLGLTLLKVSFEDSTSG